jgi:hypothetical protein
LKQVQHTFEAGAAHLCSRCSTRESASFKSHEAARNSVFLTIRFRCFSLIFNSHHSYHKQKRLRDHSYLSVQGFDAVASVQSLAIGYALRLVTPQLSTLALEGTAHLHGTLLHAFSTSPTLVHLTLLMCYEGIVQPHREIMQGTSSLRGLRTLSFSGFRYLPVDISPVSHCTRLVELALCGTDEMDFRGLDHVLDLAQLSVCLCSASRSCCQCPQPRSQA